MTQCLQRTWDNTSEVDTKEASYRTVQIHRHTHTQNNVKKPLKYTGKAKKVKYQDFEGSCKESV